MHARQRIISSLCAVVMVATACSQEPEGDPGDDKGRDVSVEPSSDASNDTERDGAAFSADSARSDVDVASEDARDIVTCEDATMPSCSDLDGDSSTAGADELFVATADSMPPLDSAVGAFTLDEQGGRTRSAVVTGTIETDGIRFDLSQELQDIDGARLDNLEIVWRCGQERISTAWYWDTSAPSSLTTLCGPGP